MPSTLRIQQALAAQGYNPGPIDGIQGSKTEAAIIMYNQDHGLGSSPYVSERTLSLLFGSVFSACVQVDTPWLNEISKHMGLHEVRNHDELVAWLRSDGATVGDPAKIPWCADAVQTAIKLSVPNEPFSGKVRTNPYFALNWLDFGKAILPCYGAIAVFFRDGGGHIGFLKGVDPDTGRFRVRGGNQSNSICDTWIAGDRLKGCRWPTTYIGQRLPLPRMNSDGAVLSVNEA